MSQILPFQSELRPALPTIIGNVDYLKFEEELKGMDEILRLSGVEKGFVERALAHWLEAGEKGKKPSGRQQRKYQEQCRQALRCTVPRRILGEGYRGMSRRLAECALFQWFCGIDQLGVVSVPSKSQMQRYTHWLPTGQVEEMIEGLLQSTVRTEASSGENVLKLANPIDLDTVWLDTTCVKANIHFPVDWKLLGDATRTLMQATQRIREHGLKERMEEPEVFISRMNKLCIEMTHTGRKGKAESQKGRKRVLRKKLAKVVRDHALRHRDLLDEHWQETDWTRPQAEQVLGRIDDILLQLPEAIKQAQGLIVDWKLYEESAPSDDHQLPGSLERIEKRIGQGVLRAVGGDRGFDSASNRRLLEEKEIFNGLCPRAVKGLKNRQKEERFKAMAKRRAQTEGRIGILKNEFFGNPMRSKGIEHRKVGVASADVTRRWWSMAAEKVT